MLTVCGDGQLATGATVAAQVKVTVTAELFQPFAFAAGDALVVISGGVRAMFTVAFAVAERPATLVAVPLTV